MRIRTYPAIVLALNGKPVHLNNIHISGNLKRDDKDMSGQASSTQKTDKGIKAKELNVSGIIPYRYKEWLSQLINLAEAENEKGEQVKYRISCTLAEMMNVREVKFSGSVNVNPETNKLAWTVSFTLREVNSVAEKKTERQQPPAVIVQTEQAPVTQPPQPEENEKVDNSISAWINNRIGA